MTAVKASGSASTVPESFSMISIDRDNVVCETVKEAEYGEATVVRLYECKNIKGYAEISFGMDVKKCYACDLMENELYEIPVNDGKISLDIGGYEIVTLKLI